jgi:hypothetical protein
VRAADGDDGLRPQRLHALRDARGVVDGDRRRRDADVVGRERGDAARDLVDRCPGALAVDDVDAMPLRTRDRREREGPDAGDLLFPLAHPVPASIPTDVRWFDEDDGGRCHAGRIPRRQNVRKGECVFD